MNLKDLIGKYIVEIHLKISEYSYSGSIPLEQIDVELRMSSGQIVIFPHHLSTGNLECTQINPELKQVFPAKGKFNFFGRKSVYNGIEDKKIIAIWKLGDEFGEEIGAIEFINGYFLVQGPMAPMGTGHTDLFLFDSKKSLQKRFKGDLELVHGLLE